MGRPIKKKFFGNLVEPGQNQATGGLTGVGGQSVATISIGTTGTLYSTSTSLNVTFTAPQIKGGVKATAKATTDATGNITGVTLVNAGSGYTSIPTASLTASTTGTTGTFVVTLTPVTKVLNATAVINTATLAVDIMKQEAARKYLVQNDEGVGSCVLVTSDTLAKGEMNIVATDSAGATYFVKKLTARRAVLVNRTNTSTAVITGGVAAWTIGAAVGQIVTLAN